MKKEERERRRWREKERAREIEGNRQRKRKRERGLRFEVLRTLTLGRRRTKAKKLRHTINEAGHSSNVSQSSVLQSLSSPVYDTYHNNTS